MEKLFPMLRRLQMAIKLENYDKGIEELIKIVNTLEKEQLSLEKKY